MNRGLLAVLVTVLLTAFTAPGCSSDDATGHEDDNSGIDAGVDVSRDIGTDYSADSGNDVSYDPSTDSGSGGFPDAIDAPRSDSGSDVREEDTSTREEDTYTPPSDMTYIVLQGNSISVDGPGATVEGTVVTVTSAGAYDISGTLNDGQVVVSSSDDGVVQLIFDGMDITCTTSAPIYVADADSVRIVLASGTSNSVTDGSNYVLPTDEDEPNAAIFSKDELLISGSGSLVVDANYNDGIASKDGLTISGGSITITAVDDGIRGKDFVVIGGGNIHIDAGGDGVKSDNADDAELGYISVTAGTLVIDAGADAIDAETDVTISGGNLDITSGGGSNNSVGGEDSAKGIKGTGSVSISNGTFTIDSADDGIHSNGSIFIGGGTFTIASADDGVHSDESLTIDGGDITITKSYEGLEATEITIDDGTMHITASDDGINVAGGADSSGGGGGWPPQPDSSADYILYINGGYIAVNANGDGVDSNGSIEINGGVLLVNGPTMDMNGPMDIGEATGCYFKITGGFVVASGSSGMAIAPGTTSTQYSVLINMNAQSAGTIFHLQTSSGTSLLTWSPVKTYESVLFSSPDLTTGSHAVYLGGSSTGSLADSLYTGGTYTPGSQYTTFTISSVVTRIGGGGFPP